VIVNRRRARVSASFIHVILGGFAAICIIPLWAVISISLSSESSITSDGYRLIPKELSLLAYRYVFKNPDLILRSYFISIVVTALGTLCALLIISLVAFPLSRRDYRYRKQLTFFVFFTMLFNGGLVPWYILISRYLELKNTLAVMIIPYLVIPWFVLLLRTFFSQLPMSLFESAKIDGANEFRNYFTILLPLSKPALATVGLFITLHYWNDWWLPLLYIEEEALVPLQYMLSRMMANITFLTTQMTNTFISIDLSDLPNETARMAMCMLAAGPMLFVFPFFQKYFVRGLTAGSLKG
jgi:putative aldouronate transport system permease protein